MKKLSLSKKDWIYLSIIVVLLAGVIACSVFLGVSNSTNIFRDYYNNKCYAFKVENLNLAKGQIVFIGDSITDFCPLDEYYSDLDKATYNRGIGGDTTDGVLKRLQLSLFDIAPSKIVLMIGINDINGGKSNEYVLRNYEKILQQIKDKLPSTEVYCMSILSLNIHITDTIPSYHFQEKIKQVKLINPQIQTLAENFGYTYLDLFSLTIDENDNLKAEYTDDCLHLNSAGFTVWASLIKPYLA